MHTIRTIYSPGVAMVYIIHNLKTGEDHKASTCGVKDIECKPWRSPKGTPHGKEFFKMKLGNKKNGFQIITFLNSSIYNQCISEDGEWEFKGIRPDGGILQKVAEVQYNKKETPKCVPITDKKTKVIIQNIDDNKVYASIEEIHNTIENEEFVDMDEMNKILN
jgi:hypothetical protein